VTAAACSGEPVSWLRLEQLALAELTDAAAARAHLARCPACAAAFARITDDARPLPRLAPVVAPAPWWKRWQLATGGAALVVAAAVVLLMVRKPDDLSERRTVRVKGAGAVVVTLVRERAGAIAFDPVEVRPDDRWKVQLTCDPGGAAWVDVVAYQDGQAFFPLAPRRIACGNAVVVPGAFRITDGGAELCVVLAPEAPDRARLGAGDRRGATCTTLRAR